jgi:hypothetical protein
MNFLAKLEKNKILWWVIVLCTIFIFLRLPSIIEPYWYGDEGIYEVVGQSMDHGRLLYQGIWDNKPPLLYVIYALAQGDQPTVKIISLIFGLCSVVTFFLLSQKLFKKSKTSLIITALYVLLFGTPILEGNIANAEDFMLFPIILGGLLIYNMLDTQKKNTKQLKNVTFTAGLLLGIAFLLKIVAIFDFATFLIFLNLMKLPENFSFSLRRKTHKGELGIMNHEVWTKTLIPNSLFLILGFLSPLCITILYFVFNHTFLAFLQTTFSGNVGYVGFQNGFFGIPQGLLIIKLIFLVAALYVIFHKRKKFTRPVLFIILWTVFSLFNAYFSQRPYTHYVIVLLPSFCLLIGLLITNEMAKSRLRIFAGVAIVLVLIFLQFQFNIKKSYQYYPNAINFLTNKESVTSYQSFFDPNVPRDYSVAAFINKNTTPSDNVFIWGNNPQIYALTHKLPPGKYTVAYHILQNNATLQTQEIINKTEPKYIIALKEIQPLPFALPLYIMRYNIQGAIIYERSF